MKIQEKKVSPTIYNLFTKRKKNIFITFTLLNEQFLIKFIEQ